MKRCIHWFGGPRAGIALVVWALAQSMAVAAEQPPLATPFFDAGGQRGKAMVIAKGRSVSQTVAAESGLHYTLTVLAHTPLMPDPENGRYRSGCYLELTFLPSQKRHRIEMASPFGDSREFVEHAVGGQAPEGTQNARITIVAEGGAVTVEEVRWVPHHDSRTHFALKKLCLDTAIVERGQAQAKIVLPASGVYDALGRQIAARIGQLTGVEVPVVRDSAFDLCRNQRLNENLIVLGNRSTNRVISDLYDLYYCILDLRYPGKGGSVVRSLHDPFGDGHNVLLIGASDAEGMNKAVAGFISALDAAVKAGRKLGELGSSPHSGLTLGHLARIELGSDVKIPETMTFAELDQLKPWDATGGTGGYGWTVISKAMALYYLSGHPFYARELLRLAFPKDDQTLKDLQSCGQDFAGDRTQPLVDVYHYRAHLPVVYWDLIEESPVFSDADRARVTQAFLKQVAAYRSNKNYGCEADKAMLPLTALSDRHTQWAAMTFFTLGRYLGKYYPDYEWRAVRRGAENSLAPIYLKRHVYNKAEQDKLERYPTTVASLFAYTLMSGNKAPVKVGSLQEQARGRIEMLVDWKEDAWVLSQAPTSLFNQMAYLFRSARYLRMRDLTQVPGEVFRPGQSYWPDEAALEPEKPSPSQWEVLRLTLEERAWWALVWQQPLASDDRMFRLCSYKWGELPSSPGVLPQPDGRAWKLAPLMTNDFLLFEGIHAGGVHKCFALVEHMLNGDILFMGARTHLNTLSDGMTAVRQPRFSVLERAEANGPSALIEARVPDYNGLDWKRTVLHRQGQYTLFLDTLTSQQDTAASTVEINWALGHNAKATGHAPGSATIRVAGGGSQQATYVFNALSSPAVRLKTTPPGVPIHRSEQNALVLRCSGRGQSLDIAFDLDRDIEGEMVAEIVRLPSGGLFRMELDGVTVAREINAYARRYEKDATAIPLGHQRLKAGSHTIRLASLGQALEATGARIPFRGFRMFSQPASRDYILGLSSKLPIKLDEMGTIIGSVESGDTLTATWNGPLAKGQTMRCFSLVAPKTEGADAAAGNCVSVGPNAAVLALPGGPAIAAAGEHDGLQASIAVMATDHLLAYGATRCGEFLASDSPVDVDWSFTTGKIALNCSRRSTVTLASASTRTVTLDAGKHAITDAVPPASLLAGHRARLASAFNAARSARLQASVVGEKAVVITTPAMQPVWEASVGDFPFDMQVLSSPPLRGGISSSTPPRSGGLRSANALLAVTSGKNVLLFDAGSLSGASFQARPASEHAGQAWKLAPLSPIRTLQADDLVRVVHYWPETGVLAAGCRDFRVIAFDPATGQRRWVFQSTDINPEFKKEGVSGWFDRGPTENKGVHALASGVFLGGRSQLLVGTASTVEALGEDGKLLRSFNAGVGVVTDIALLDCGAGEVRLFPARLFGHSRLQHTSSRTPDKSTGLFVGPFTPRQGAATYVTNIGNGYAALEAADLDGDGRQELVGLFNGTLNGIHVWDRAGNLIADTAFGPGAASPRPSWQKLVQTPNMRGLSIADLDGDGKKELCVITARGFAIVLNHRCEKLWARSLPSDPTAVVALAAEPPHPGRLVVACRDGSVHVLDATGKFLAQGKADGVPARMERLSETDVALVTAEGRVVAYRVR